MSEIARVFAVYQQPRDFPRHLVVRGWTVARVGAERTVERPDAIAGLYPPSALQDARRDIILRAPGAFPLGRAPQDEPSIVETWIA